MSSRRTRFRPQTPSCANCVPQTHRRKSGPQDRGCQFAWRWSFERGDQVVGGPWATLTGVLIRRDEVMYTEGRPCEDAGEDHVHVAERPRQTKSSHTLTSGFQPPGLETVRFCRLRYTIQGADRRAKTGPVRANDPQQRDTHASGGRNTGDEFKDQEAGAAHPLLRQTGPWGRDAASGLGL